MLTEEEYLKLSDDMDERDRIANALADAEDIATGRIKSAEHLKAVDDLLDVLIPLSNSIECIIGASEKDIYGYVNSRTIPQLNEFFEKVRTFTREFDQEFGIES